MDGATGRKTATGSLIAIRIRPRKKRTGKIPVPLLLWEGVVKYVGTAALGGPPGEARPSESVELRSTDSRGRLSPH